MALPTFRFTKEHVSKGDVNYINFRTTERPDDFRLVSPSGKWIVCKFDGVATMNAYNEAEGWDGEWDCSIYSGMTNGGKRVTVMIGNTPYDGPEDFNVVSS